jgi:hypothetical protein
VEALRSGREDELTDDERLLAGFIRDVVSGTVDDETFAVMRERLGRRGVIEYTGFILWLQWIIRMMQAVGVEDPSDEEMDSVVRGLQDGSVEIPDFRRRLG